MEVTTSAREHLFETISQQYEAQDAETLKALLMSMSTENLATKQDIAELKAATKQDVAALKDDFAELRGEFAGLRGEFAEFKAELHQALYQQSRTYVSWMFGMLTVYTAMAGSFVAFAAIITH